MARHILFLCIENSARSQMAEGLARHFLGHQADVTSAGTHPSAKINPMAVAAMAEIGIDISNQRPKSLSDIDLARVDLVITLSTEDESPVISTKTKTLNWPLSDPSKLDVTPEDQLRKFRKVRDDLRKRVLELRAADQVW